MKITFLEGQLKINGGRRVIFIYADILNRWGHDVTVVTINSQFFKRWLANLIDYRLPWMRRYKFKLLRVPSFDSLNIPSADIIVADEWKIINKFNELPDRVGFKIHFVQHDERLYHGNPEDVDKAYRSQIKKIVIADWLREMFIRDYNYNADLVLNSVDKSQFTKQPRTKSPDEIRILMLHHTYAWKGTKEGVAIVQELKKHYPNVKLILFGARKPNVGEIPHDEYYYNLPQEKLAWLYSNSDIFLCPSWDEGFTLPSVEAMACGCALVTYGTGSARHYAFDGKTAMVAERLNQEDLYRKTELLVKDANLRSKIAQGGYEFVQKMATWEDRARELESIFKKELNKNA